MPAQAAISEQHNVSAREEDSNPPRLGRGTPCAEAQSLQTRSAICVAAGAANTRGSTEARDHFDQLPWPSRPQSSIAEFGALAAEFYSPRRCFAHYLHMAFGNWRDYLRGREEVSLKKYLYVFRPLLACS